MVRAAAKNFNGTTVLTNPNQYENFIHIASTNKNLYLMNYEKKWLFKHLKTHHTMKP